MESSSSQVELRTELTSCAKQEVGSVAAERIHNSPLAVAEKMLRDGFDSVDAVLATIYPSLGTCGHLRKEFFGYLWSEMNSSGHASPYGALRRYLETGDLLGSAFGDMLELFEGLEFRGRKAYISMIRRRMRWKAYKRIRTLPPESRFSVECESLEVVGAFDGDDMNSVERRGELFRAIGRLHPRERALISAYLEGQSGNEIARKLEISSAAARKALERALNRLRSMVLKAQ